MKRLGALLPLICGLLLPAALAAAEKPAKVLVVTVTAGYRHASIATAEKILAKIGKQSGAFSVDYARQGTNERESRQSLEKLSAASLANYDAVIFANTTGDLPLPDHRAFINWIKRGGAFIGMHSASDTLHGYRPYVKALGGEFQTHGAQVTVDVINQAPDHPACEHLKKTWTLHDEIYLIKNFDRSKVHVLLALDKHPNTRAPGNYPIAWTRPFGKGRVFYTSLGHRKDVWKNESYQKHILGGIQWALSR